MARCIQNNYLKAGRHSRGIKPQLLRVLYATDMPGVLTEIGFMSNAQEMAYMKSEKGQDEIARSIYEGVRDYSAYVLETRRAEEEAAAAPKPGKEPETQVVIGKEPVRPAEQDKASDAPAAKTVTPEKGEPERGCGQVRGAETGTAETGQGRGCPQTSRPAAALYRAGAGQRADRADLVRTFQSLPQQGETVYRRGAVPL